MGGMEWVGKWPYHNRLSQPSKNLWCYRWCNVGINDSCPKMCSTFFPSNIIAVLPSSLPQFIMLTRWISASTPRWSFSIAAPPSFWKKVAILKDSKEEEFARVAEVIQESTQDEFLKLEVGHFNPPSSFLKQNSVSFPITSMFLNVSIRFPAPRQDILVEKHQRQRETL